MVSLKSFFARDLLNFYKYRKIRKKMLIKKCIKNISSNMALDSYGNFTFECVRWSEEYAFDVSYAHLTHAYLMSWKSKPTLRHCYISFQLQSFRFQMVLHEKVVAKSRLYQFVGSYRVFGVWKLGWRCINISNKSNKVIEGAICRCLHCVKYVTDGAIDRKWVLLNATSHESRTFA